MTDSIETVIIGGGQAGLSVSYYLSRQGREHVILEQAAQAGDAWRNHRWDSFTFVTPNWMIQLPGGEYQGDDPDGYLSRDEIVKYFEQYLERYRLPVQFGVKVTGVEPHRAGYLVTTGTGAYQSTNVVIATGGFQRSKVAPFSRNFPAYIRQLGSDEYRNPDMLPPGAVLVVGTGQSGCQIAEELYLAGRKVYLSVGSSGRVPRRYRGKDITFGLNQIGWFDRTVEKLPSPKAKFAGNPHVTGAHGGHSLNLHQFARDGVVLLGHLRDMQKGKLVMAPDIKESLAKVDKIEVDLLKMIDDAFEKSGLNLPKESLPVLKDGYSIDEVLELDLEAAGITSLIWAMGYNFDYSLVRLPIFDEDGYPRQTRGVTAHPGLFFVGLNWLHKMKSGLLFGVGEDAQFVASRVLDKPGETF